MKPPANCSKAPPSIRITSWASGFPGQIAPGSTCQIAPKEIPVLAMDSMITHGIVSIEPTATTTRIDHQGVSVGHAVTATTETMKPNVKRIEYYHEILN